MQQKTITCSVTTGIWEHRGQCAVYLTFDWRTLLWTTNFGFRVRESNLMKKPPPALRSLSLRRSSSAVQYCDFLFAVQTVSWSSWLIKKWVALAANSDTPPPESLSDRILIKQFRQLQWKTSCNCFNTLHNALLVMPLALRTALSSIFNQYFFRWILYRIFSNNFYCFCVEILDAKLSFQTSIHF